MQRVLQVHRTLLRAGFSASKGGAQGAQSANTPKLPKTENIRKGWDLYAHEYANHHEERVLPSQMTLFYEMYQSFKTADTVIEAASGTGCFASFYLKDKKPEGQNYTMYDLSPGMMSHAKDRLSKALQVQPVDLDGHLASRKVRTLIMDSEDLQGIPSDSTDLYFGGLFLHLVNSPDKVLSEAFRVLKKGGRLGLSVFGDQDKSLFFTLFDKVVEKHGHIEFRSKFHLNSEVKLREMLNKAGFVEPRFLRQDISFSIERAEDALNYFSTPANQAILKKFSPEVVESMKKELQDTYAKILKERFIGVQTLIFTAKKP